MATGGPLFDGDTFFILKLMNLLELTNEQLAQAFKTRYGKGVDLAAALYRSFYRNAGSNFVDLSASNYSKALLSRIEQDVVAEPPPIVERVSEQGVTKLVLGLHDGSRVETVIIPMENHTTVCVSSQVGCRMGCRFCRTARMGLQRNLTVAEMVGQVYTAKVLLAFPVRNVVFMGMGEPLDNFAHLSAAIDVLEDQRGLNIAQRHITVSTAGLVPGIEQLALQNRPRLKVAVSLNAPNDDVRSRLMPINRAYPMAALKDALQKLPRGRGSAIFMEYVQISQVNDAPDHARQIAAYVADLPVKLNLIPCNPVEESPFAVPTADEVARFRQALVDQGVFVRLRSSKGIGIHAACGQLGSLSTATTGKNPTCKQANWRFS